MYLSGLPDAVADLSDFIERGVGAEREVGSGHVVTDGGGDYHQWQAELWELAAGLVKL